MGEKAKFDNFSCLLHKLSMYSLDLLCFYVCSVCVYVWECIEIDFVNASDSDLLLVVAPRLTLISPSINYIFYSLIANYFLNQLSSLAYVHYVSRTNLFQFLLFLYSTSVCVSFSLVVVVFLTFFVQLIKSHCNKYSCSFIDRFVFFFLLASSVRYFFFQNIISKYIAWVVRIEYALTRPIEHSCQVINHSRLFALANGLRFFCLPLQLTFRVFVPKKIWPFFNKYSSTLCMSAFVETYQHNVYFMMI